MTVHRSKAVIAIVLIAFISACSFKSIYNRLDDLIPEYVEGIVTLDEVLEEQLYHRTELLIDWHRKTQLKQYADWLRALQRDIGVQLTQEKLEQHVDRVDTFWLAMLTRLNDEMAYLLPLLDDYQKRELFSYIDDKNESFREEIDALDDEERIDGYIDSITDSYENWIGELTEAQLQAVGQAATELVDVAELRLQRRLEWQQGIREILSGEDSRENKSQRLRRFLAGYERNDDQAMNERMEINRRIIISLTLRISHRMTTEQNRFFISKTNDYIRMFIELAENR